MDHFGTNMKSNQKTGSSSRLSVSEMIMEATSYLMYENITPDNIRNYVLRTYNFDVVEHITDSNLLTRSSEIPLSQENKNCGTKLLTPHFFRKSTKNLKSIKTLSDIRTQKTPCKRTEKLTTKTKSNPACYNSGNTRTCTKLNKSETLLKAPETSSKVSNQLMTKTKPKLKCIPSIKTRSSAKLNNKALCITKTPKRPREVQNQLTIKLLHNTKIKKNGSEAVKKTNANKRKLDYNVPTSNLPKRYSLLTRQTKVSRKRYDTKAKERKTDSSAKSSKNSKRKLDTSENRKDKSKIRRMDSSLSSSRKGSYTRKNSTCSTSVKTLSNKRSARTDFAPNNKIRNFSKKTNISVESIDSSSEMQCTMNNLQTYAENCRPATESPSFEDSETSNIDHDELGSPDVNFQESGNYDDKGIDMQGNMTLSNEAISTEYSLVGEDENFNVDSYNEPAEVLRLQNSHIQGNMTLSNEAISTESSLVGEDDKFNVDSYNEPAEVFRLQKSENKHDEEYYIQNIIMLIEVGYAVFSFLRTIASRCSSHIGWSKEKLTSKKDNITEEQWE